MSWARAEHTENEEKDQDFEDLTFSQDQGELRPSQDQDQTGVSQLNAVQSVYNMDVCNTCTARTSYGNQDYEIITQGNYYYDMTAKTVQNTEITILIKTSTENC